MPVGKDYDGPNRIPVDRAYTADSKRLVRPFRLISPAEYYQLKLIGKKMQDDHYDERKKKQNEIAELGHVLSVNDPSPGPLDGSYKILKTIYRSDGRIRLILRRQE